jgi:hypothetical protein
MALHIAGIGLVLLASAGGKRSSTGRPMAS